MRGRHRRRLTLPFPPRRDTVTVRVPLHGGGTVVARVRIAGVGDARAVDNVVLALMDQMRALTGNLARWPAGGGR